MFKRLFDRRTPMTCCCLCLTASVVLFGFAIHRSHGAQSPTTVVRGTIGKVIRILTNEDLKGPEHNEKRHQLLEQVIGKRFDYKEMSKRTLSARWRELTRQEQAEFVELFKEFLSEKYADKLDNYSGEQVKYLDQRLQGDFAEVRTMLISSKTELPMTYRLLKKSGGWQVYDIVIDGVSLVKNYRSQFRRVIRDSSYAELVGKIKEQIANRS